jgi:hypothetical protein
MNGHQWSGQGWSKIEREGRDFGLKRGGLECKLESRHGACIT